MAVKNAISGAQQAKSRNSKLKEDLSIHGHRHYVTLVDVKSIDRVEVANKGVQALFCLRIPNLDLVVTSPTDQQPSVKLDTPQAF